MPTYATPNRRLAPPGKVSPWLLVILVAWIAVVLLPLAFSRENEPPVADAGSPRLIIVTPHNDQLRYELEQGFNAWRVTQNLPGVIFDWRSWGGTSDLRRGVIAAYEADAKAAVAQDRPPQGSGYDLFLGGGNFEHDLLARGVTLDVNGEKKTFPIAEALPPEVSDALIQEVFPEPTIGGEHLYHPKKLWFATALSSFGIVYNRDVLGSLDLPDPTTWADLADPRYFDQVSLADPGRSGSITATYDIILRRLGPERGWPVLHRAFANTRSFAGSASGVPTDVSAGEAAAGMCIDFYGRYQAQSMPDGRVGYVDPPKMTAITADPVMLLSGAQHKELATEFILWLLSKDGQTLLQRHVDPTGQPAIPGAPRQFELRRLPARRDVYTPAEMVHWTDPVDAFAIAAPLPAGMPTYFPLVAPVSQAMAIHIHEDLIAAWRAILHEPEGERRQRMLDLFDAMPDDLQLHWPDEELAHTWPDILAAPDHPRREEALAVLKEPVDRLTARWKASPTNLLEDQLRWTRFFQSNYRRITELAAKR
ncbi:MAG: extracellular solute-binding protein [Phycisphaeraceae bacterium]|nr:extracellular solute-binding protein [Phycisphaeraceae bacterium]